MTDTDTDADDELETIRQRKREALKDSAGSTEQGDPDQRNESGERSEETTPDEPVTVQSPDHFATLIDRHDVLLVDFYADWCGPCKMLAPVVDDLAADTDAAVLKVDVDAHQGLAREHQVQSVPTVLVYADGRQVDRVVGVADETGLRSKIEAAS